MSITREGIPWPQQYQKSKHHVLLSVLSWYQVFNICNWSNKTQKESILHFYLYWFEVVIDKVTRKVPAYRGIRWKCKELRTSWLRNFIQEWLGCSLLGPFWSLGTFSIQFCTAICWKKNLLSTSELSSKEKEYSSTCHGQYYSTQSNGQTTQIVWDIPDPDIVDIIWLTAGY